MPLRVAEWTDEYKGIIRKRLAQIIEWSNAICLLPLVEAQEKFPKAKIRDEQCSMDGRAMVCRSYVNPFGGKGWRIINA